MYPCSACYRYDYAAYYVCALCEENGYCGDCCPDCAHRVGNSEECLCHECMESKPTQEVVAETERIIRDNIAAAKKRLLACVDMSRPDAHDGVRVINLYINADELAQ